MFWYLNTSDVANTYCGYYTGPAIHHKLWTVPLLLHYKVNNFNNFFQQKYIQKNPFKPCITHASITLIKEH